MFSGPTRAFVSGRPFPFSELTPYHLHLTPGLPGDGVGAGNEAPAPAGARLEYGVRQAAVVGDASRVFQPYLVGGNFLQRDGIFKRDESVRRVGDLGGSAVA